MFARTDYATNEIVTIDRHTDVVVSPLALPMFTDTREHDLKGKICNRNDLLMSKNPDVGDFLVRLNGDEDMMDAQQIYVDNYYTVLSYMIYEASYGVAQIGFEILKRRYAGDVVKNVGNWTLNTAVRSREIIVELVKECKKPERIARMGTKQIISTIDCVNVTRRRVITIVQNGLDEARAYFGWLGSMLAMAIGSINNVVPNLFIFLDNSQEAKLDELLVCTVPCVDDIRKIMSNVMALFVGQRSNNSEMPVRAKEAVVREVVARNDAVGVAEVVISNRRGRSQAIEDDD